MDPKAVIEQIQSWLKQEKLSIKVQQDMRAEAHFLIKYPAGNQGHMFAVVVPKGRDSRSYFKHDSRGQRPTKRDG